MAWLGYVVLQFGLLVCISISSVFTGSSVSSWQFLLGAILLVFGLLLGVRAVRSLGPNLTVMPTPKTNAVLVEIGTYRLVRHPMYGALMLVGIGWSMVWGSWWAFGSSLLLMLVLFFKSRLEEKLLQIKFGEYAAYQKRTKRFIPWLW